MNRINKKRLKRVKDRLLTYFAPFNYENKDDFKVLCITMPIKLKRRCKYFGLTPVMILGLLRDSNVIAKDGKHHYTYGIKCLTNGMRYIGVRTSELDPSDDTDYMGSCKTLKKVIKELGIENFTKTILHTFYTRKEAMADEVRLHNKYDVGKNPKYYNQAKQTSTRFDTSGTIGNRQGARLSDATKKKISQKLIGKPRSKETKIKISNTCTGKVFTEEHRAGIASARKREDKPKTKCAYCSGMFDRLNMGKYHGEKCKSLGSKAIKHNKIKCPNCKKSFYAGTYSRWHGPRCKSLVDKAIPRVTVWCKHCDKNFSDNNYTMWHGPRCKSLGKKAVQQPKMWCEHCDRKFNHGNHVMWHGPKCKLNPANK